MRVKAFIAALCSGFLLLVSPLSAYAQSVELPSGAVKGLPERLAALDNEGKAVNSATGEYFFRVEDMQYGVEYTKTVQLMNLREDAAYHIYFYIEPLYKKGEIDLEEGCECTFWLDNNQIYQGTVTGNGNIDLTDINHVFDCGLYLPGDSHQLKCSVVWNNLDVLKNVDNGHRLVDKDGEHVLIGPDEEGYVEGEIEFKWIFYAAINEDSDSWTETEPPTDTFSRTTESVPSETDSTTTETSPETPGTPRTPFTGYLPKNGTVWLVCMGVISVLILILLILIHKKKRRIQKK